MTDQELRMLSAAIQSQLADAAVPDEVILDKVREVPELLQAKLPSSANLFLAAVSRGRFELAKKAAAMGADIHWRCEASGIGGNALNAARTPEQAEELLARAFCHEIEHLDGHMYTEHVTDGLHDVREEEE